MRTVLVSCEEPSLQLLLRVALELAGWEVAVPLAEDPLLALGPPLYRLDAIVAEGRGAWPLCETIRGETLRRRLPVVLIRYGGLTGPAVEVPADLVLAAPADPVEVVAFLRRWWDEDGGAGVGAPLSPLPWTRESREKHDLPRRRENAPERG
jgi:hypothetical protein